jgi:molybdopterin synthase catalytic subunit
VKITTETARPPRELDGEPSPCVVRAAISDSPLDVGEHEALVAVRRAGAVVSFGGVVRDHDYGRTVTVLEYSAHPGAAAILAEIASDIAESGGIRRLAVSHRVGRLAIGDVALACAVSADHRAEAFASCAALVAAIKARLPVWKFQVFADGTEEWVGVDTEDDEHARRDCPGAIGGLELSALEASDGRR